MPTPQQLAAESARNLFLRITALAHALEDTLPLIDAAASHARRKADAADDRGNHLESARWMDIANDRDRQAEHIRSILPLNTLKKASA
ncbi:MAG: hypothetical protein QM755_02625 [Luteolibacter sp.]